MTRHSEVDQVRLRELWDAGESVKDIAAAMGITTSAVYKVTLANGFPVRERGGKPPADPSVEEIYAAAARIRSRWSAERLAESSSGGWTPPRV